MENRDVLDSRRAGRYRLNDEDKATKYYFGLYKEDIEILEYLPGKNDSAKLRKLLHDSYKHRLRIGRQMEKLKEMIDLSYRALRLATTPTNSSESKEKITRARKSFLASYEQLIGLINLFAFEMSEIEEYLGSSYTYRISAIVMGKEGLSE